MQNVQSNPITVKRSGVVLKGFKDAASQFGFFVAGISLLLVGWWIVGQNIKDLPTPIDVFQALKTLLSDPYYERGPNDRGILNLLLSSLSRVAGGFLLGALVAIPLGVLMGSVPFAKRLIDPIVQLLRPVSPLAWFPIGLTVFQSAEPATVFIIFITALWPTVINTAFGVANLPKDFKNVARVFKFTPGQYITKVLIPFALPHIITGLRISFGIAWMVIVAAEMLSGKSGIGFYVWDAWNALNLSNVISAIFIIGFTGLLFDRFFGFLERKVKYE
ncbi:nitrate ABC transporter permease [Deinococcus cellulosilyticus]|uniref:Nitrate ABC transporter, permease protein n=1 Tax=Deinococcus cellulosilyticus (strain DSM 18568 / NBRC 106333 / KACC 11606 / 5516J-15) TaxID=1223518 RepID=A0A511N6H8_DEIC1|nr:nitrate ABC transporter permease [Deinococcus cellulosilyticus]GEM48453.1 nitrate ABC transporter, permease protein [Deinococcus cellulosilyticus NBRC 106333 = KACC 11606]